MRLLRVKLPNAVGMLIVIETHPRSRGTEPIDAVNGRGKSRGDCVVLAPSLKVAFDVKVCPPEPKKNWRGLGDRAQRKRISLSTKIHAMVDALGNPLAFFLTAEQVPDLEGADALLPQMKAGMLLADKRSVPTSASPIPSCQQERRLLSRPEQPKIKHAFDRDVSGSRSHGEFLLQAQAVSRHRNGCDKTARNFLAAIHLAAAIIWLN
jgi:transposase